MQEDFDNPDKEDIIKVNELIEDFAELIKDRNSSPLVIMNACLWIIFSVSDEFLKFEVHDLKCIFEEALLRYDELLREKDA